MNPYTNLAYRTIKTYLKTGVKIIPPDGLPTEMLKKQAGTFVSIHTKDDHSLRGCIGTFLPTKNNIAEEIIANAISASTQDSRFDPITEEEMDNLEINVDVLSKPEQVKSMKDLDAKKYGIIVKTHDGRSGLLLPDLKGVNSSEHQIMICCQKGGIDPRKDELILYRFKVTRYK